MDQIKGTPWDPQSINKADVTMLRLQPEVRQLPTALSLSFNNQSIFSIITSKLPRDLILIFIYPFQFVLPLTPLKSEFVL